MSRLSIWGGTLVDVAAATVSMSTHFSPQSASVNPWVLSGLLGMLPWVYAASMTMLHALNAPESLRADPLCAPQYYEANGR